MRPFLQLIRVKNLAIIVLTMYAMRIFFVQFLLEDSINFALNNERFDFFLLVFSLVLIAAAGNVINDYFDVKADRINKPERLIISRHIKRRWAIFIHWTFNLVAFATACYLSWKHNTFMYVFIHLVYINLLWIYSTKLKRQFFIGNVVIAALTGFIPVYASFYFLNVFHFGYIEESWYNVIVNAMYDYIHFNPKQSELGQLILNFGLGMGLFAFLSNLAREIVKDMEDVKGDLLLKARTIPIVLGAAKSKQIVTFILLITTAIYLYFILSPNWLPSVDKWKIFAPITVALFAQLIACGLLFSKSAGNYKRINILLKISMLFGLSTPIYIVLLHAV